MIYCHNSKIKIKQETKLWLQKILHERISCFLNLNLIDDIKEKHWVIRKNNDNKFLRIKFFDDFFELNKRNSLSSSLIEIPKKYNAFSDTKYFHGPGLKEDTFLKISIEENYFSINYDIIGLIFWVLTRLEEVKPTFDSLDKHKRFKGHASHAYKYGYIDRPIVDEWLSVLSLIIKEIWPELETINRKFRLIPTHDVDSPSKYEFTNKKRFLGRLLKSVLSTRSFIPIKNSLKARYFSKNYLSNVDPYNNFDWLMQQSEKNGFQSHFYFIAKSFNKKYDADYNIYNNKIINLIKSIKKRNHILGMHFSYDSYLDKEKINLEAKLLKNLFVQISSEKIDWQSRMHYLRWEWPETAHILSENIIKSDSTLSYADMAGFRCGTCIDFEMFNPISQKLIGIRQYPLIVMDRSISSKSYQNLGLSEEAYNYARLLRKRCEDVNGNFICLWHNNQVETDEQKNFYSNLISL